MSTRNSAFTIHPAIGGLDISSDPTVLDPNFLTAAMNTEYLEGGQRAKRLGILQYSPSSSMAGTFKTSSPGPVLVTSSSNVRAISDSWMYDNSLTPTQRYIAVAGASIFRSTGDGNWTAVSVSSSFGANANLNTNIMLGQGTTTSGLLADMALISDGIAAPVAYWLASTKLVTPSTGASTAWPIFESAVYHQRRGCLVGLSTAPSKFILTAADNIMDTTGADAFSASIDIGDGDRIMGVSQSFYGSLYFFKGPQFGSVHQLTGTTPTNFAITKVAHGAPVLDQHSIVSTPTDIYWLSPYGIHSLQTTVKYGNVEQAFLSLPIQRLWRDALIVKSDLVNANGFWNPLRNIVGWLVTPTGFSGQGSRKWVIVYNYALSDPKPGGKKFWSMWQIGFGANNATVMLNPTAGFQATAHPGEPHLFYGSDQGLVYQGDWAFLNDDGAAYTQTVTTPIITRFQTGQGIIPETQEKQFVGVVTYFNPAFNANILLEANVDGGSEVHAVTIGGGGDTLA